MPHRHRSSRAPCAPTVSRGGGAPRSADRPRPRPLLPSPAPRAPSKTSTPSSRSSGGSSASAAGGAGTAGTSVSPSRRVHRVPIRCDEGAPRRESRGMERGVLPRSCAGRCAVVLVGADVSPSDHATRPRRLDSNRRSGHRLTRSAVAGRALTIRPGACDGLSQCLVAVKVSAPATKDKASAFLSRTRSSGFSWLSMVAVIPGRSNDESLALLVSPGNILRGFSPVCIP